MADNHIVCTSNQVDYITIRKAMCTGARTIEDLKKMLNVCTTCEGCKNELNQILSTVCGCKSVSMKEVLEAVSNGAKTVDQVSEITGAGTGVDCGRCKVLIENILLLGK